MTPLLARRSSLREVNVLSRQNAIVREPQEREILISIFDPEDGPPTLRTGWSSVLSLSFSDIEVLRGGSILFSRDHACQILDFAEQHWTKAERLTVHCRAGVSRSAAVGRFIARISNLEVGSTSSYFNRHVYSTLEGEFVRRFVVGGVAKSAIGAQLGYSEVAAVGSASHDAADFPTMW